MRGLMSRLAAIVRRERLLIAVGLALVGGFGLTISYSGQAEAATCLDMQVACNRTFFFNSGPYFSGKDLFTPVGLGMQANNIWDLFGGVGGRMLCKNAGQPGSYMGVPQTDQNGTGAAFIVLTMLGYPPGTPKNVACEQWNRWTDLVGQYDAAGLIHYNEMHDFDCVNTAFAPGPADVFYYAQCGAAPSVVFYGQNGQVLYAIKRDCGNPIGKLRALTNLTPPSGDLNPPTSTPGNPPGFDTGNSSVNSSCSTISGHATDPFNNGYAVPVTITYKVGATTIGTSSATASTSGSHLFTSNTPAAVRGSPDAVQVTATGRASNGATFNLNNVLTIGPCITATPACAGAAWAPTSIDPGTPYTVTANVRYNSAAEAAAVMARADTKFFINIVGPGVNRSTSYTPAQITRSVSTLTVTTSQQPATGQTGTYIVGYGISGSFGAINCGGANTTDTNPPKFDVAGKPYFTVKNGDISAGAGMSLSGSGCSAGSVAANQKAGVASWNRGSAGGYGGAGSQYGVLALGHIQDFASGQGSALAPTGASFANKGGDSDQVDIAQGLFGGEFGGSSCSSDYFTGVPAASIQTGNVQVDTQTIPNCTGSNDAQCRRVIYVKGNVYITGNIAYSGSYSNTSQIPSFSIVASGNIYIAPGVTRLDGLYIAQPASGTSTDGVIYTCATSATVAAALDNNLATVCNTALTVNGAFQARQVWLLRTAGSVSSTPAETFNYTPEIWLNTPFGNGIGPAKGSDYDAITSLPPVL